MLLMNMDYRMAEDLGLTRLEMPAKKAKKTADAKKLGMMRMMADDIGAPELVNDTWAAEASSSESLLERIAAALLELRETRERQAEMHSRLALALINARA